MQEFEVNTIIENLPYLDRNSWEQNRLQVYTSVQMNSRKKLNPTDIITFAWDNLEENTTISSGDIERLKKKSKEIFNSIKNNG